MPPALISVAVPLPFQQPFTYRLPPGVAIPDRGCRVQVPFGERLAIGVVTGPGQATGDEVKLKEVAAVLDESPLVASPLLDLATWVSEHYLAPPGECYRLVLPPAGVRARRAVGKLVRPEDEGRDW